MASQFQLYFTLSLTIFYINCIIHLQWLQYQWYLTFTIVSMVLYNKKFFSVTSHLQSFQWYFTLAIISVPFYTSLTNTSVLLYTFNDVIGTSDCLFFIYINVLHLFRWLMYLTFRSSSYCNKIISKFLSVYNCFSQSVVIYTYTHFIRTKVFNTYNRFSGILQSPNSSSCRTQACIAASTPQGPPCYKTSLFTGILYMYIS